VYQSSVFGTRKLDRDRGREGEGRFDPEICLLAVLSWKSGSRRFSNAFPPFDVYIALLLLSFRFIRMSIIEILGGGAERARDE